MIRAFIAAAIVVQAVSGDNLTLGHYPHGATLRCSARDVCSVELRPDEHADTPIILGDSKQWQVLGVSSGSPQFVYLQRTDLADRTNVIIDTTNNADPSRHRHYVVDLVPGDSSQTLVWEYGEEDRAVQQTRAAARRRLSTLIPESAPSSTPAPTFDFASCVAADGRHWKVTGNALFRPTAVCRDGGQTYIEIPASAPELPAVVTVAEPGERDADLQVNLRVQIVKPNPAAPPPYAHRYSLDTVANHFTLTIGSAKGHPHVEVDRI